MSQLAAFVDFVLATKSAPLSDVNTLINQATRYRTSLIPRMLSGRTEQELLQSGKDITDFIQLSTTSSYQDYNPTDNFNYTASNSLSQLTAPWRFSKVSSVTWEHELLLQNGDSKTVFKKVKLAKLIEMEQSFWEGMEASLWAAPNNDTMEASTVVGTGAPYSLRCFITADGLVPSTTNGGLATGDVAWSTIMGQNPTTKTNWRNQYETFDNTSATTRRADSGLLNAMNLMWLDVQFKSPSTSEEYWKNTQLNKMVICACKRAIAELIIIASGKNNIMTPVHDVGYLNGKVTFAGIPLEYIAALDDIDTYGDGDGVYSGEKAWSYRFINFNHIKPIFHAQKFRQRMEKDGGAASPHAKVLIEDTWHQLWCANRREQGIVRPASS